MCTVLRRYGSGMLGGRVGGLVMSTDYLPVGVERETLLAELESTGLNKIIVDTSTGDSLVVGDVNPHEVQGIVAATMRGSANRPTIWPPVEPGSFPLVGSWSYPFGSDDGTGRDLFLSGRGSRPIRVFLAPDLFEGAPHGRERLLLALGHPQIETLVLDAEMNDRPEAIRIQFEPDADHPFDGLVRFGSGEHPLAATDSLRVWRSIGSSCFRALNEADAADRAERDVLGAHIAHVARADLIVTDSPLLLSRPDGIVGRIPQVNPTDALALIGLYLRQRDSYLTRRTSTPDTEVRADRSHYFRAAARGTIPSLHRWRAMLDSQPHANGGSLALLGESFEHRVSRLLGQRDELLASLLIHQDTNTSFRAMEHLDAFLVNLTSALDVTCRAADRLASDGIGGHPMGASWTRKSGRRLRQEYPRLTELFDEPAIALINVVSDLRNTTHAEMLVPEKERGPGRSGITLVAFRPRVVASFESNIAALGELDEWGAAVDGLDVRIDPRRFIGKALPLMLEIFEGLLSWMLDAFGGELEQSSDLEFGSWYPGAVCGELALGPRRAPRDETSENGRGDSAVFFTGVLGVVDREGAPTGGQTRAVLSGTFEGMPRPYVDFDLGDRITASDPLLESPRVFRVEGIDLHSAAGREATFTVSLSIWNNPSATSQPSK